MDAFPEGRLRSGVDGFPEGRLRSAVSFVIYIYRIKSKTVP